MAILDCQTKATRIKSIGLVVLTIQNSASALVLRLSKTQPAEGNKGYYLSSTAIVTGEALKALVCAIVVWQHEKEASGSILEGLQRVIPICLGDARELLRILVPSLLYLTQNFLQYYAISNLPAATFQLLCQLKILTTAIFSILLLNRQISRLQWLALFMLMAGVATIQMDSSGGSTSSQAVVQGQNMVGGLIAVLLMCCCSGFAGVYTEKILKGSDTSLWVRNVQMGVISGCVGLIAIYCSPSERASIADNGFYFGYNAIVWFSVFLQGLGGLLTALVMKYADNVIKSFATSIAVVLTAIVSIYLFGIYPNQWFVVGASLVNSSVLLFSNHQQVSAFLVSAGWGTLAEPTKNYSAVPTKESEAETLHMLADENGDQSNDNIGIAVRKASISHSPDIHDRKTREHQA